MLSVFIGIDYVLVPMSCEKVRYESASVMKRTIQEPSDSPRIGDCLASASEGDLSHQNQYILLDRNLLDIAFTAGDGDGETSFG